MKKPRTGVATLEEITEAWLAYEQITAPHITDGRAKDRLNRYLAERDRQALAQAWQDGWEEGQNYAEAWYRGDTDIDTKGLKDNPYRKEEEPK